MASVKLRANGVLEDYTTNGYTEELINVNNGFIYSFSIKAAFYFALKKKEKKVNI